MVRGGCPPHPPGPGFLCFSKLLPPTFFVKISVYFSCAASISRFIPDQGSRRCRQPLKTGNQLGWPTRAVKDAPMISGAIELIVSSIGD